jgi:hypothetical protein
MAEKITVTWDDATQDFTYTHTLEGLKKYKIKKKQFLSWRSDQGAITILFSDGRSPFDPPTTVVASAQSTWSKARKIRPLTADEKKTKGAEVFKYSVALLKPAPGSIVLTDDPDIIIDDPVKPPKPKTKAKKAAKPAKKKR